MGLEILVVQLEMPTCPFRVFFNILFAYSRSSRIDDTNLDGVSARFFFMISEFSVSGETERNLQTFILYVLDQP